ncbi:MAG: cyclic nucleotide-binding domain-containing protein [Deltaproteobacteria bacterium]|nr:cyclic nucleotide-binding domain-containing protein [Deltaproteobacteria bacterium]
MDPKTSLPQLADHTLFGGLGESCRQQLLERLERREIDAGEIVYREGDIARELYIVESGRLEVFKPSVSVDLVMFEIGSGEFFGDLSFIDMQPRSMTVRAGAPCVLWRLDYCVLREVYQADIRSYTLLIMNIAREISRRLRRSDENRIPADGDRR